MSKNERKLSKRDARKVESLRRQLRELQQRLAGARKQPDDPREIQMLEHQVASVEAELKRLLGN